MAGAQGDNSLGFLWMVIGFYFFVKAMKTHSLHKKDIINALLAGLFFGIMAFSWQMSLLIPMIAIPYFIFALAFIAYNSHKESLTKSEVTFFSVKFFIIMIFYTIISYAVKRDWITDMLNWLGGAISISPEMTGIILIAAALGSFIVAYFVSQMNHEMKKLFFTLAIIGLYAGFAFMAFLFFTEPDLFYRNGGREAVTSMVGEESVGNSFFGTKYNALIVFPWVGLLLLPVGLYFFNKKDSHSQIIFWFWTIITLFMAWYKLKFTFVFGLGIVTGAAITAYLILETLKHFNLEKGLEAKASLVCLFFIIALGVGASGIFVPDYTPHANSSPNWISTMNWIKINTPQDAKLFNWWNEGHMISFITGRKVSSDNRNFAMRANQGFAEFVIETDTDKAYNVVAKEFGADYIIISSDMFYSMVSFEYYYANKVVPEKGAKYSEAPTRLMGCSDLNTIISCEGNNIPKEQYDSFSKTWKSLPDEFYNGEKPLFFYADNSQLVVLNQAINNTNLAKVWLNSEETSKYYEEVYATPSIKIFKVLK
jgi:asparagine N-glycosylation enzyme membrane subunit Stt3